MGSDKGLDSLQVWQRSMAFAKRVLLEVVPHLPVEEKWAMANQIRRAVQSIPANIAEGYGRFYYQEGVRFCYIARGSLEEVYSFLVLANELGYLQKEQFQDLVDEIRELHRMLNGYISFLKRSKRGENEPGSDLLVKELPGEYEIDQASDFPDSQATDT